MSSTRIKKAIGRAGLIVIVVIIIVVIAVAGYSAVTSGSSNSSSSTTSSSLSSGSQTFSSSSTISSSSSSLSQSIPSSMVYETVNTPLYLDPQVTYFLYDGNVMQSVYEPLVYYKANTTEVIPWLAQNYTSSPDGRTVNFTLRSGITFGDGEPFNSTAVYFSYNRLLIEDGSSPVGHGVEASWILQQLLNTSLSTTLSGKQQPYTSSWVQQVLAQDFVQITGPLSLTLHIQNPNAALPNLLSGVGWATMVAPGFVMSHDLGLWSGSSSGYNLPFGSLSGNATSMINQYFMDEAATCNSGITPKGCGTTYLDGSFQGSSAGTGPYTIQSVSQSTSDIVLQANAGYWGGPYQFMGGNQIVPKIKTIYLKYVPELTTREFDLANAAKSGQAMAIDIPNDHLYDVADRNAWLANGTLDSVVLGVKIYGPYTAFGQFLEAFTSNVTNPLTGTLYTFQPFADLRFRLALSDAVNISEIDRDINNNLGQVAINAIPPRLPPAGSYDSSIVPRYRFNLTATQDLLLDTMLHPLTSFTFRNGTAAPSGFFNNKFGCVSLGSNGQCANPVTQSVSLTYWSGDTVDQAILTQIASSINNISATYNMGLTLNVVPLPLGQEETQGYSGQLYMWALGGCCFVDYPWAVDVTEYLLTPGGFVAGPSGWNFTEMTALANQIQTANSENNISGVVSLAHEMSQLGNQEVMYLWTFYPETFQAMTSNIQGYYYNPALYGSIEYFAALY